MGFEELTTEVRLQRGGRNFGLEPRALHKLNTYANYIPGPGGDRLLPNNILLCFAQPSQVYKHGIACIKPEKMEMLREGIKMHRCGNNLNRVVAEQDARVLQGNTDVHD